MFATISDIKENRCYRRIRPNQDMNWGLLHYRWILYQLSCQGRGYSRKKLNMLALINKCSNNSG